MHKFAGRLTQLITGYVGSKKPNLQSVGNVLKRFDLISRSANKPHLAESPNAQVNKTVLERFMKLPQEESTVMVEYIWIDGTGESIRAKTKTLECEPKAVSDLPSWTYDGRFTYQSDGSNSNTYLHPVAMYKDPFRRGNNLLALCETFKHNKEPTDSNHRVACAEAIKEAAKWKTMLRIEQKYTLLGIDGRPFGWTKNGVQEPQGPYYCGVGTNKVYGRDFAESHYRCCLYSGINISGVNAEVTPSQWEYQIGPCEGISAADQLWLSRYLLHRVAEEFGIVITLDPKPMTGDWDGARAHCNFRMEAMQVEDSIIENEKAVENLWKKPTGCSKVNKPRVVKDNKRNLTGKHETSSVLTTSSPVANRGTSAEAKKSYLEDCQTASNCDPYQVTEAIIRTVSNNE